MAQSCIFVSLLAANADHFYGLLARYLAEQCGIEIQLACGSWQERAALIEQDSADIAAVCGAVYVRAVEQGQHYKLLAAPVMRAPRYTNQPVYFSDVVVRQNAPEATFADLRGAVFAVNEAASFSGHAIVCAALAEQGETAAFFSEIVETGAHQASLRAVVEHQADAAAIDSLVLAQAFADQPGLRQQLRVLSMLGPHTAPPLIAAPHMPLPLANRIQAALFDMPYHPDGQRVLEAGQFARFAPVDDTDFASIRKQLQLAATAPLLASHGSTLDFASVAINGV